MSPPIYYRIAGNAVTLVLQTANCLVMLLAIQDDTERDPLKKFDVSMSTRYMTMWNVAFQIVYSSLALASDILTVIERDNLMPKCIKELRNFFFSAVVFPGTWVVFTVFWSIYLYDRNLVYPEYLDSVFPQKSGYVLHIAIVPTVIWELAYQPRKTPQSHTTHLTVVAAYYVIYNLMVHYTYYKRGVWPYPLMGLVYGTVYNVLLHLYVISVFVGSYFVQWPLKDCLCVQHNECSEIKAD